MPKQYPAAVAELRTYSYRRLSAARLCDRLSELEAAKYAITSSTVSPTPTAHGGTRYEARLDSLIDKSDAAVKEYRDLRAFCAIVEAGLAALPDDERVVLEKCYVERNYNWAAAAAKALHISERTAYNIRDAALEHYVMARGL